MVLILVLFVEREESGDIPVRLGRGGPKDVIAVIAAAWASGMRRMEHESGGCCGELCGNEVLLLLEEE